MSDMARRSRSDRALFTIGCYKLFSGVVIAAAAAGATQLFHKNVAAHAERWLDWLRIDPDNRFVGGILTTLHMVHTKELKGLAAFGVCYSLLFLTEGIGLIMGQRWAAWLTVVATSVFLPLEIYEIVTGFSIAKVGLFVVNAGIVAWLVYNLKRGER